jgi:predicted membrane channel-forming protein YqfA (hemolysin III family)
VLGGVFLAAGVLLYLSSLIFHAPPPSSGDSASS